jgi:hypothetical protein
MLHRARRRATLGSMFYVGITAVADTADPAAAGLALGATAYDVRRWSSGTLPTLAYQGMIYDAARARYDALARHGYGVLMVDSTTVPRRADMVDVHRIDFGEDSLGARGSEGPRLRYGAISLVLHVTVKGSVTRLVRDKDISPSGMRNTPMVERQHVERTPQSEQLLFIMPYGDDPPWVLSEKTAQFLGLGAAMQRAAAQNFVTALNLLRQHAPGATFDARFAAQPILLAPAPPTLAGATPESSRVEVLVHLLRLAHRGTARMPYRQSGLRGDEGEP